MTDQGHIAQSVTSLTTDPGVASLIPAGSHTFVEIDHEIISTAILLLPLIQEGLLSVTRQASNQTNKTNFFLKKNISGTLISVLNAGDKNSTRPLVI